MRTLIPILTLAFATSSFATTASVFSPDVAEGDRSFEYRMSYIPEDRPVADIFSHRLHFQYAFDGSLRARLVANQRSIDGGSLDYRSTRLEVQWQYRESETQDWDAALRFDVEFGDEAPDRIRLVWTGQRNFGAGWQIRGNALLGREFGSLGASGVTLETRAQVTRSIGRGKRLGLEIFNDLNSTADVGHYSDQEHKLGPIFKADFGRKWTLNAGYLFGISDDADNGDWRLMIVHRL